MQINELIAHLKSIYIWAPKNSVHRNMVADLIRKLGGVVPEQHSG